ncbi:hypothetical protein, partial [Methylosinus sp. 3S-1]|uniref:hypothetical protein n=1 Tax=Methylosinus sp. 3S-1 TaxID=1849840 RepID=UPI001AECDE62
QPARRWARGSTLGIRKTKEVLNPEFPTAALNQAATCLGHTLARLEQALQLLKEPRFKGSPVSIVGK